MTTTKLLFLVAIPLLLVFSILQSQVKADDCLGLAAAGLRAENTGNITKINAANAASMDCLHKLHNNNNTSATTIDNNTNSSMIAMVQKLQAAVNNNSTGLPQNLVTGSRESQTHIGDYTSKQAAHDVCNAIDSLPSAEIIALPKNTRLMNDTADIVASCVLMGEAK